MIRVDYNNGDVLLINPVNVYSVKYYARNNETQIRALDPNFSHTISGDHTKVFENYTLGKPWSNGGLDDLISPEKKEL